VPLGDLDHDSRVRADVPLVARLAWAAMTGGAS